MTDLICKNTMRQCQTPGMCSPFGGCRPDKSEWQAGYDEGRRMGTKTALDEREQLRAEVEALRAEVALLNERNEAMGRYVSFGKRQKSQYFRAVKWFLANTNFDPATIPTTVRLTLEHVAKKLIEQAQRAAEEAKP